MRKGWVQELIRLLLLLFAGLFVMGANCDPVDLTTLTEKPPDKCPSWDTDCDEISNATETNSANSYLNLDTNTVDANPSLARGQSCRPCNGGNDCGWIDSAFNMVNSGTGYYHYLGTDPVDTDDWGVLASINMIEGAGRDWYTSNWSPPRIGVGDLSWGDKNTQQFGRYWPPHHCHQNGLEVDIRYVRNDGQESGLNLGDSTQVQFFDVGGTVALMSYLFDNSNPDKIYVSSYLRDITEFSGIDTVYDTTGGHDDHFHFRIEDPDGTGN